MSVIKVFISYAHESNEFRESVRELAIWLNLNGNGKIVVSTDHLYTYKARKEGWQVWMHDQIVESDLVLIICTPKYNDRFVKNEEAGKGLGAIYEGAIITTAMYQRGLINEKFIPIIPDDGSPKNVPLLFRPFFNYLSFPNNYEGIMKAIFNDNPSLGGNEVGTFVEPVSPEIVLENEIVEEIFETNLKQETNMFSSIHALVRSFLELSDMQKILIAKNLAIYEEIFLKMQPDERDKKILKLVNDKKQLRNLWDEINNIKPFNLKENPFK